MGLIKIWQALKAEPKLAAERPSSQSGPRRVHRAGSFTHALASSPDTMPSPEHFLPVDCGLRTAAQSKANAVGGSVVPTNARPSLPESYTLTPGIDAPCSKERASEKYRGGRTLLVRTQPQRVADFSQLAHWLEHRGQALTNGGAIPRENPRSIRGVGISKSRWI